MKRIHLIGVLMVLVFAATCMVTTVSFAQEKIITLRYSNFFPPQDPQSLATEQWCKEVEKRTNGKIKVRYYPGGTLNSMPQMYESVVKDVADIGLAMTGLSRGRFPLMEGIWNIAFGFPNALVTTRIVNAAYKKFMPREFDDVKVLYFHCGPDASLHTVKKPIQKLEDLRGLKIRTSDANAKIMAEFGAAPVMMPAVEVYDGLSKGLLDGVTMVCSGLETFKLADSLKYTIEIDGMMYTGAFAVVMNKGKWNSIPADLQKVIGEINAEYAERQGRLWDTQEKAGKDYAISKGMKISRISAAEQAKWDAKARSFSDEYIAKMKKMNLPGEAFVEFVNDSLKKAK